MIKSIFWVVPLTIFSCYGMQKTAEKVKLSPIEELFHLVSLSDNPKYKDRLKTLCRENPQIINAPNATGHRPIHVAVRNKNFWGIAVLIGLGADVNSSDFTRGIPTPLTYVLQLVPEAFTEECASNVAKLLVDNGADPNKSHQAFRSPLASAIAKGLCKYAECLIDLGAHINESQSALSPAQAVFDITNDSIAINMIQMLARKNANFNKCGTTDLRTTLLISSILSKRIKLVEELVLLNVDVNFEHEERTPIRALGFIDDEDLACQMLEILNQAKVNLNTHDDYEPPLIITAIITEKKKLAKKLLELGADVNLEAGGTPLECALITGQQDLVKLIMNNYRPINLCGVNLNKQLRKHSCTICKKIKSLKYCSGCQIEAYCSADCQKRDWENHKPHCKTIQLAAASENTTNSAQATLSASVLAGQILQASVKTICAACKKTEGLSYCSVCKIEAYCSKDCQKTDWKNHKPICKAAQPTAPS